MIIKINEQEYQLFKNYIQEQCGIFLGNNKEYLLETRLINLINKLGCKNFNELYLKLKFSQPSNDINTIFIDAITTNETLWFRDKYPFRVLEQCIFPNFLKELDCNKKTSINIWSAGCSTGQEPYSVAIIAYDYFKSQRGNVLDKIEIIGTDISRRALSVAASAQYDDLSINRGMVAKYLDVYFKKQNNHWMIEERIQKMVKFKQFNFKDSLFALQKTFDIIFLRNVIIYFSDSFKQMLFERIIKILNPGGYLFLGTGETISGYSSKFDMIVDNGSMFYKLK